MREDTRTASLAASALCVASHLTGTPAVPAVRPLHRSEHAPRPVGLRYVRHVLREGLARCTRTLRSSGTHLGILSNLRPWFSSSSTADRHRHRLQCGRSRVSSRALHPNSTGHRRQTETRRTGPSPRLQRNRSQRRGVLSGVGSNSRHLAWARLTWPMDCWHPAKQRFRNALLRLSVPVGRMEPTPAGTSCATGNCDGQCETRQASIVPEVPLLLTNMVSSLTIRE